MHYWVTGKDSGCYSLGRILSLPNKTKTGSWRGSFKIVYPDGTFGNSLKEKTYNREWAFVDKECDVGFSSLGMGYDESQVLPRALNPAPAPPSPPPPPRPSPHTRHRTAPHRTAPSTSLGCTRTTIPGVTGGLLSRGVNHPD